MIILYSVYAIDMYVYRYGGVMITTDMDNGCINNCQTGGSVNATLFIFVWGGLSLGQVVQYAKLAYIDCFSLL